MAVKIVVGAVGNAPKFAPAERESELEVGRGAAVEAKFFLIVVAQAQVFFLDSKAVKPIFAVFFPVIEPFKVGAGFAEEFKFHLFKLADAEDEVAGGNFVSERLADLSDTERHFRSCGALHVFEVYEDTLRGFGTKVHGACRVFRDALESLEHKVEFSHAGEVGVAADRARDFVFPDIFFHLFVRPAGDVKGDTFFGVPVFDKVVGAMTGFARFAVHKRVGKTADMSACFPDFRIHKNRAVKTYVIFAFGDEFFPPRFFDIVFKFDAQRTVVPGVCKTAVNFASREDEAAVFRKRDEFIHCQICHKRIPHKKDYLYSIYILRKSQAKRRRARVLCNKKNEVCVL